MGTIDDLGVFRIFALLTMVLYVVFGLSAGYAISIGSEIIFLAASVCLIGLFLVDFLIFGVEW